MLKNEVILLFTMSVWDSKLLYQPFQSLLYISTLRLFKAVLFNRRKINFELRKVESDFLSLMR